MRRGVSLWLGVIFTLSLQSFLIGCSDTESQVSYATASTELTKHDASSDQPQVGQNKKTALQQMADLGFEPARKEARVDFQLTTLNSGTRTLDDYTGHYVLLNFWATWCGPCRVEMPALERLHQDMTNQGLLVVGVDVGEQTAEVQRFVTETGITFEIVIDEDFSTGRTYAARSLPMTYILDPQGTIVARAIGLRDWDSEPMRKMFRALVEPDADK